MLDLGVRPYQQMDQVEGEGRMGREGKGMTCRKWGGMGGVG
jgi:hypothetical protein